MTTTQIPTIMARRNQLRPGTWSPVSSRPSPVLQRSSDHAPELHEPVSRPTGRTPESRLAPTEESRLESLEESHGQ